MRAQSDPSHFTGKELTGEVEGLTKPTLLSKQPDQDSEWTLEPGLGSYCCRGESLLLGLLPRSLEFWDSPGAAMEL